MFLNWKRGERLIAGAIGAAALSICAELRRIDTSIRHASNLTLMTREDVLRGRLEASRADRRRLKERVRYLEDRERFLTDCIQRMKGRAA